MYLRIIIMLQLQLCFLSLVSRDRIFEYEVDVVGTTSFPGSLCR